MLKCFVWISNRCSGLLVFLDCCALEPGSFCMFILHVVAAGIAIGYLTGSAQCRPWYRLRKSWDVG